MVRKRRIAFVVTGPMYPDSIGGAEIFCHKLGQALAKREYEVHIIAKEGNKFKTSLSNGVYNHSYRDIDIRAFRHPSRLFQTFLHLIRAQPDFCLSFMFEPTLACYLYAKIFKKTSVVRFAGYDLLILSGKLGFGKKKAIYKEADVFLKHLFLMSFLYLRKRQDILVLNQDMYNGLIDIGADPSRLHLIYNFVEDSLFELEPNIKGHSILFCGRLIPAKGVDVLLKALAIVRLNVPDASLTIVGDGVQRPYIESLVVKLNLSSSVKIVGFVPTERVADYLSEASLFVVPSVFDQIPNALLDAMAAGLPVVGTSVGGIPDIIEDGVNGLLVEPNEVTSLAQAIILLLSDKKLACKLGESARNSVSVFRKNKVVKEYIDLIDELTKEKACSPNTSSDRNLSC